MVTPFALWLVPSGDAARYLRRFGLDLSTEVLKGRLRPLWFGETVFFHVEDLMARTWVLGRRAAMKRRVA